MTKYRVTITHGAREFPLGTPMDDEAEARERFEEVRPTIGRTGPRPRVRLWALIDERIVERSHAGN